MDGMGGRQDATGKDKAVGKAKLPCSKRVICGEISGAVIIQVHACVRAGTWLDCDLSLYPLFLDGQQVG